MGWVALLLLGVLALPVIPLCRASNDDIYSHRFEYDPPAGASPQAVVVAGDFNGWSQTATPMHHADGGAWVADVDLSEGPHLYKFIVDGQWTNDTARSDPEFEQPDGHGGTNSAVLIGPDARHLPPLQPGVIEAGSLIHDITDQRYCNVVTDQRIRLVLRARSGNLDHAVIRWSDGGTDWKRQEMYVVGSHLGFDDWGGLIDSVRGPIRYFFELTDGPTTAYYAGGQVYSSIDDAAAHAYGSDMQPLFETPEWARRAVWYQIFPERFRNGDPSNDPPNTVRWTSKWFSTLPGESGEFYHDVWRRRYGGDIQGIEQELPYLRSLGITCIYLNPIFKAEDLHKYDTSDYRHVDDHFGYAGDIGEIKGETDDPSTWQWTRTDRLFLDFVADAHRQGFHVILDGVFNHVGKANYAFQDVLKNGQNSRYASWFNITSWNPVHWMGWGGSPDGMLPEFRKDPQLGLVHGPRELVLAITRRWLAPDGDPSRGVDGFRLDVCQNIPQPFWVDWRKLVKSIKPDAYTSGEIWTICPTWLDGQTFDATMQYPFAQACESFFVDQQKAIAPTKFGQLLSQFLVVYPFQISLDQMNLLDSHDTDRWASRFVNPDLSFNASSRIEDNNPNYDTDKPDDQEWTRIKQSLVVQMTYVGAPMIYYGDEAGMWGPSDPSDREPMIWKDLAPYDDPQVTFKQDLFDHYQRLIAIRQALPALQTGFAHTVLADDSAGVYAFSRDLGDQHVCVIVNRSGVEQTEHLNFGPADDDGYFMDWLDPMEAAMNPGPPGGRPIIQAGGDAIPAAISRHGQMVVTLKPWGSMVLSQRN